TELDRQLHDDFEVVEQMLERTPEGGVRWRADPHHAKSEYPENRQWLEVWSPEGQLLYGSPASGTAALGPAPVWSQEAPGPGALPPGGHGTPGDPSPSRGLALSVSGCCRGRMPSVGSRSSSGWPDRKDRSARRCRHSCWC